jgi:hypothetical protein
MRFSFSEGFASAGSEEFQHLNLLVLKLILKREWGEVMNRKLVNGESVVEKLTNRIHPSPIQSFKISGPTMVFRLGLPTFPWVKKSRGSAGEPTEKGAVERSQAQNNREILDKSREKKKVSRAGSGASQKTTRFK